MPTVTPDDVRAGFLARWAAVPGLQNQIPAARVYESRAAEQTELPYARLTTRAGGSEGTSGNRYLQRFTVQVEAYTNGEAVPDNALPANVAGALDEAFRGDEANPSAGLTVPHATAVVRSKALPGGGSATTGRRVDAKDVVRVTAAYEILVQGAM